MKLKPIAYTAYAHWGTYGVPIYFEKTIFSKNCTFHLVRNKIPKGDKGAGKLVWDIVIDGVSMGTSPTLDAGVESIMNWFRN